jgi:hypothetical protein
MHLFMIMNGRHDGRYAPGLGWCQLEQLGTQLGAAYIPEAGPSAGVASAVKVLFTCPAVSAADLGFQQTPAA